VSRFYWILNHNILDTFWGTEPIFTPFSPIISYNQLVVSLLLLKNQAFLNSSWTLRFLSLNLKTGILQTIRYRSHTNQAYFTHFLAFLISSMYNCWFAFLRLSLATMDSMQIKKYQNPPNLSTLQCCLRSNLRLSGPSKNLKDHQECDCENQF
jgi:hypothetical protein